MLDGVIVPLNIHSLDSASGLDVQMLAVTRSAFACKVKANADFQFLKEPNSLGDTFYSYILLDKCNINMCFMGLSLKSIWNLQCVKNGAVWLLLS